MWLEEPTLTGFQSRKLFVRQSRLFGARTPHPNDVARNYPQQMDLRFGMVLNRNTDRRRRLLVDSNSPTGEATAQNQPASATNRSDNEGLLDVRRAYAIGARRRHQQKIIDLIPKRPLAYSAAIGVVALLLIGVNVLAYFSPNWKSVIGSEGVAAFALVGPQSITTWLATIFLALTAALCLQIYAVRQHRSDDYEGAYRIWAWLSLVLAVCSLACVVPVAAIAENVFSAVTGREFATAWLPAAIGMTFASLLLVRYLMEVRASYGTVAWASLAWLAICVRVSSPEMLAAILPAAIDQNRASELAWGNGLFLAAAASLLANVTYGRFVFLRANGFVASAPKRIEQASASASASNSLSLRERLAMKRAARKQAADQRRTEHRAAKAAAAAAEKSKATATPSAAPIASAEQTTATAQSTAPTKPAKPKTKKRSTTKPNTPAQPKVTTKTIAPSKGKKAKPAAPIQQESEPEILKMSSSVARPTSDSSSKTISDSASARLKQMADAARAKKDNAEAATDESAPTIKKLSKSERRRQRKNQRQQKRAA